MQLFWPDSYQTIFKKIPDRTKTYISELHSLGLLHIQGRQAPQLLQGQLTCHIEEVMQQSVQWGAHCNPQGRAISFFRLFYLEESFFLQMPKPLVPIALSALKKYAPFFKVELLDLSDTWRQVACYGPEGLVLSETTIHQIHLQECRLLLGEPLAIDRLLEKTMPLSNRIPESLWELTDIRAKVPRIYPITSEKFLPHELNLPELNAVSFKKGCYTGQEVIARMHYRGKLKNQLYHAKVTTPNALKRNADIYSHQNIAGSVVDFVKIEDQQFEILIVANTDEALFLSPDKQCPIILDR